MHYERKVAQGGYNDDQRPWYKKQRKSEKGHDKKT